MREDGGGGGGGGERMGGWERERGGGGRLRQTDRTIKRERERERERERDRQTDRQTDRKNNKSKSVEGQTRHIPRLLLGRSSVGHVCWVRALGTASVQWRMCIPLVSSSRQRTDRVVCCHCCCILGHLFFSSRSSSHDSYPLHSLAQPPLPPS